VTTIGVLGVIGGVAVTPEFTVLVVGGGEGGRFMLIVTPELENVSFIAMLIS
jgi:hypothetical protein